MCARSFGKSLEHGDALCFACSRKIAFRQNSKRQGLQGVAGQNGGGLIKLDMASGLAAAQLIIIHGGQIIMDQRIGVNTLHG
ncbi:Uncharacterised protein [Vibrio cholerae]|nr:Uncharacterised protein [Vibrio cholerae]